MEILGSIVGLIMFLSLIFNSEVSNLLKRLFGGNKERIMELDLKTRRVQLEIEQAKARQAEAELEKFKLERQLPPPELTAGERPVDQ